MEAWMVFLTFVTALSFNSLCPLRAASVLAHLLASRPTSECLGADGSRSPISAVIWSMFATCWMRAWGVSTPASSLLSPLLSLVRSLWASVRSPKFLFLMFSLGFCLGMGWYLNAIGSPCPRYFLISVWSSNFGIFPARSA